MENKLLKDKILGLYRRLAGPRLVGSPLLLDRRETLEFALANNCSIARFGDGEIMLAFQNHSNDFPGICFQKSDPLLCSKLMEILLHPVDNLLVCFNSEFMRSPMHKIVLDYERSPGKEYSEYLSLKRDKDVGVLKRKLQQRFYRKHFAKISRSNSLIRLGEATCFSLCFFLREYTEGRTGEICDLYRSFFQGRRILVVCPEQPLLGESFTELFANGIISSPARVDFLTIPPRDCFGSYSEILAQILTFRHLDAVFLQAGPTATLLAAELTAIYGLKAYDVGSLNVSLQKAAAVHGITF